MQLSKLSSIGLMLHLSTDALVCLSAALEYLCATLCAAFKYSHVCVCCLEQVAPHAAASGSKQQHAATFDIAAVAVSKHVESALGIPQYTGAARGHASSQVCTHCTL